MQRSKVVAVLVLMVGVLAYQLFAFIVTLRCFKHMMSAGGKGNDDIMPMTSRPTNPAPISTVTKPKKVNA